MKQSTSISSRIVTKGKSMVSITVQKIVNAPLKDVWDSWDDYANIHKFHPGLNSSYLLEEKQETGLGALRQCEFTDGKTYLKEKITRYDTQENMTIEIYGTNAPIKDASASFDFIALGPAITRVTMTMNFTPKMGLLGKMMTPLMKWQFSKGLMGLLEGNAAYVEGNKSKSLAA